MQDYYKELENSALWLGFNGIKQNKKTGEIVFYRTNEDGDDIHFKLNEGFFDNIGTMFENNIGSMLGAMAGSAYAIYNLKKGKANKAVLNKFKKGGAALYEMGLTALGGAVGSTLDYVNYSLNNGKEIDFDTMAYHALQDGLFSLAADTAFIGGRKLVDKVAHTKAGDFVKISTQAVTKPFKAAASAADTIIRKSPILGGIYSVPRNLFKGQTWLSP